MNTYNIKIMKNILTITFILVAHLVSKAQNQIGLGGLYGSEVNNIGIAFKGLISLGESFAFVPEVGAFLTNERNIINLQGESDKLKTNIVVFNLDFRYHLETDLGGTLVYALAGANYTDLDKRLGSENDPTLPSTVNDLELRSSSVGANAGLGIMVPINTRIFLYTEAKYMYSSYSQLVLSLGLMTSL